MVIPTRVGKYEVAEQIGVGGFGVVYRAWDPYIKRWVALKSCSTAEEETTQRFFREAQLAGALQHPNITLIFDFGIDDGVPYFVQELLTGTDLDDVLRRGKMGLPAVVAILAQVCAGLEYAHARGIVHRDIKPANVRVLEDGSVKIMDFGIAKSVQAESRLTQTGVALGTAGYLAPEQLSGKPLDARTDLFSLAVMAYEMVTGMRPFHGPNVSNIIFKILNEQPAPPRQRCPECPERLQRAILKALAKSPDDRFPSVRDFAQQLREVAAALAVGTSSRSPDSPTAVIRTELARLAAAPAADLTSATQLAARSFAMAQEEIEATQVAPPRRRLRLWPAVAAGALVAGLAAAAWLLLSPGSPPLSSMLAQVQPSPAPTLAPPTPTPEPLPTPTPPPAPVVVTIFVDPPAELAIDGESLGRVQTTTATLTPGEHTFLQRIPGYREHTVVAAVSLDQSHITLRLPPYGLLSIFPDFGVPVRDATATIDGRDAGPLPIRDRKVEAGLRRLVVRWADGSEYSEEIEVPAAQAVRRAVRPRPGP